jgi:hypothetical protein
MYIFAFYAFSNFSHDHVLILYQKKYFWAEDAAHFGRGLSWHAQDCSTYNPSTWMIEAGSPKVQSDYPWCHSKQETRLGYMRPRKGWTIQRLPHQGIHPIISHQTQTVLCTPARFCWRDPDIAVLCEAMPMPGKYKSGCLQPSIGWSTGSPMKELEKEPKELKVFATP